ncbi:MAG: sigma-70 family RNA polymerase sigma factor [Pseudomonadales bacterium]
MTDRRLEEARWAEWLRRAQHGDVTAYDAFLSEVAPMIRAYLRARFGAYDMLDDCVQECLIALHQARHTYDSRRPLRPWLFAIVRHRTIDVLRRADPMRGDDNVDVPAPTLDLDLQIDVARLIGQLSATLRESVVLTKLMGLSTRECAIRLGVSETVIKVRVHRGLRELRRLWQLESP